MSITVSLKDEFDNALVYDIGREKSRAEETILLEIHSGIANSKFGELYIFPLCELNVSNDVKWFLDVRFALFPRYKDPKDALEEVLTSTFNSVFTDTFEIQRKRFIKISTIKKKTNRFVVSGHKMRKGNSG